LTLSDAASHFAALALSRSDGTGAPPKVYVKNRRGLTVNDAVAVVVDSVAAPFALCVLMSGINIRIIVVAIAVGDAPSVEV